MQEFAHFQNTAPPSPANDPSSHLVTFFKAYKKLKIVFIQASINESTSLTSDHHSKEAQKILIGVLNTTYRMSCLFKKTSTMQFGFWICILKNEQSYAPDALL